MNHTVDSSDLKEQSTVKKKHDYGGGGGLSRVKNLQHEKTEGQVNKGVEDYAEQVIKMMGIREGEGIKTERGADDLEEKGKSQILVFMSKEYVQCN